jgi:hypothetical protein
MGEVLIQPPVLRGASDLSFAIPDDPALIGRGFSAQALVRLNGAWALTNALDVTIGGR